MRENFDQGRIIRRIIEKPFAFWAIASLCLLPLSFPVLAVDGIAVTCINPQSYIGRNTQYRDGEIWKRTIKNSAVIESVRLFSGPASRPRLSPDGQWVVFARGSDSMICIIPVNGGAVAPLCKGFRWSTIEWPVNDRIFFNKGAYNDNCAQGCDSIYRVNPIAGSTAELVHVFRKQSGARPAFFDWHVGSDQNRFLLRLTGTGCNGDNGDGTVMWYDGVSQSNDIIQDTNAVSLTYDVPTQYCGMGLSFDGRYSWVTDGYHSSLIIHGWRNPTTIKTLTNTGFIMPAGTGHCANDSAWIAYTSTNCTAWNCGYGPGSFTQELVNWVTGERVSLGDGDCGDFFVGNVVLHPTINLNPSGTLIFETTPGTTPSAKTIALTNSYETLNNASIGITYASGSNWLTVAQSGSGNSQTLTNSIAMGSLSAGMYEATVKVTVGNAVPNFQEYKVRLNITPPAQVLTSVRIFNKSDTVFTYGSMSFRDSSYDESNIVMVPQPPTAWSLTGAGGATLDPATGAFHAGSNAGIYTVTASVTKGTITKAAVKNIKVLKPITITSPLTGVAFNTGDTIVVKWTIVPELTANGITINISPDDGLTWESIAGGSASIKNNDPAYSGNNGTFKWKIPATVTGGISTNGTNCQISVTVSYSDPVRLDFSPIFSIGVTLLNRTGWTATGSSTNPGDNPGNALDGNAGTRWSTGQAMANGQWFQVDMQSSKTVSKIILKSTNGDRAYGYEIFVSDNTGSWGTSVAKSTSATTTDSIVITLAAPASGRYIKIVQTESGQQKWFAINELNVYGNNATGIISRSRLTPAGAALQWSKASGALYTITGRRITGSSLHLHGAGIFLSKGAGAVTTGVRKQLMIRQ